MPSQAASTASTQAARVEQHAFSVMLEPRHLDIIDRKAVQLDASKAEAIRQLISHGLSVAEPKSGSGMAYEKLDRPKRVHIRLPVDIYEALRAKQAQLRMRLGELVRTCLEQ